MAEADAADSFVTDDWYYIRGLHLCLLQPATGTAVELDPGSNGWFVFRANAAEESQVLWSWGNSGNEFGSGEFAQPELYDEMQSQGLPIEARTDGTWTLEQERDRGVMTAKNRDEPNEALYFCDAGFVFFSTRSTVFAVLHGRVRSDLTREDALEYLVTLPVKSAAKLS